MAVQTWRSAAVGHKVGWWYLVLEEPVQVIVLSVTIGEEGQRTGPLSVVEDSATKVDRRSPRDAQDPCVDESACGGFTLQGRSPLELLQHGCKSQTSSGTAGQKRAIDGHARADGKAFEEAPCPWGEGLWRAHTTETVC